MARQRIDLEEQSNWNDLASGIITTGELNIYVRTDGDDGNPGTLAAPFLTLGRAVQAIPYIVAHPVIIHLGGHPTGGWAKVPIEGRLLRSSLIVVGDGAGVGDGFTELMNGVAEAGSSQYQVSASGLTPNAYLGKTVLITSGAAIGDRRHINYNDTGALYIDVPFTAAVAAGDSFRVVEPAIDILLNDTFTEEKSPLVSGCGQGDSLITASRNNYKVWFVNVRFQTTVMSPITISRSSVAFFGVELVNSWANLFYFKESNLLLGREAEVLTEHAGGCPTAQALLGAPYYTSWNGWGLSCLGPVGFTDEGYVFGTLIAQAVAVQGTHVIMVGGNIYEFGASAGPHAGQGRLVLEGWYTQTPLRLKSTIGSAVLAQEGGHILVNGGSDAIVIDEAADHGFEARDRSEIRLAGGFIGNADKYGHFVEFDGLIDIHDRRPSVTGTLGDITVDRGATSHANSTMVAGTAYVDSIHGRIQRGYH